MKTTGKLAILIAAIFLFACSKTEKQAVSVHNQCGISFSYPSGWKIDETEEYDGGCYIAIEKKGLSSSGIVTLSTVEREYDDLTEYMSIYQESLEANTILSQLKFDDVIEANYGQYSGIMKKYTFSTMNLPHKGRICTFSANGKTICIIEQSATEDIRKNEDGFQTIENSLTVN